MTFLKTRDEADRIIRYAVVGQGYFAQTAVLPAFGEADGCELTAIFSDDPTKLEELKRTYDVEHALTYEQYDEFLRSGAVDAVYIALPNDMHCDYTLRAAAAGVHVLCEKPMAVTSLEGERMLEACKRADVRLMVAYRLHLEEANLAAIELLKGGTLGQPRYFVSSFSQQVTEENIRTKAARGGGALFDLGVYCINAARYLFRDEPLRVSAVAASRPDDPRFNEVEEQIAVTMSFPQEKLASFTCGFGAAHTSFYDVVCTKARLRVEPAYGHTEGARHQISFNDGKTKNKKFGRYDQVAAELIYFASCIRQDQEPEPSGWEGLADLRIMDAIQKSAQAGGVAVDVAAVPRPRRPEIDQLHTEPAHAKPEGVHIQPASR